MQRRDFMKYACLSGLALSSDAWSRPLSPGTASHPTGKPLRVLHLTDIHIRPEEQAFQRCKTLLKMIRREIGPIDFVLNTGDSIYAADYGDITRERMLLQWDLWDSVVMKGLKGLEVLSCLGNHDSWWAAPSKDDPHAGQGLCRQAFGDPGPLLCCRQRPLEDHRAGR